VFDRWFRRRSVDELVDEAHALLEDGDFGGALRVARRIEKRRNTAAFELGALALQGMGRTAEAIAWLERGVAIAPDVWLNWQLLGNLRSDAGDHDGAREAYARALDFPGVWSASVRLNQAILASRTERYEEALAFLAEVDDPQLAWQVGGARCHALRLLARERECLAEATALLERARAAAPNDTAPDGTEREAIAYIAAQHARARLALGDPRHAVRAGALAALGEFTRHTELLQVVREIDDRRSPNAQRFEVMVTSKRDDDLFPKERPKGWCGYHEVVAESWAQAFELALAIERATAPWPTEFEPLDEDDGVELGPAPNERLGVVRSTGRVFFE
jgi:tetratricopeptide (TPR) repeat protein